MTDSILKESGDIAGNLLSILIHHGEFEDLSYHFKSYFFNLKDIIDDNPSIRVNHDTISLLKHTIELFDEKKSYDLFADNPVQKNHHANRVILNSKKIRELFHYLKSYDIGIISGQLDELYGEGAIGKIYLQTIKLIDHIIYNPSSKIIKYRAKPVPAKSLSTSRSPKTANFLSHPDLRGEPGPEDDDSRSAAADPAISRLRELFDEETPVVFLKIAPREPDNAEEIFSEIGGNIHNSQNVEGTYSKPLDHFLKLGELESFAVEKCSGNGFLENAIGVKASAFSKKVSQNNNLRIDYVRLTGTPNPKGYDGKEPLRIAVLVDSDKQLFKVYEKYFYVQADPKRAWSRKKTEDARARVPTPASSSSSSSSSSSDRRSSFASLDDTDKIMVCASVRGREHASEGKPNEDNFGCVRDTESGWNAFSVCRGRGTSPFSKDGSKIASRTSVKAFVDAAAKTDLNKHLADNASGLSKWKNFSDDELNGEERLSKEDKAVKRNLENIIARVVLETRSKIQNEADILNKDKSKPASAGVAGGKLAIEDFDSSLMFLAMKKFKFGYLVMSAKIGKGAFAMYKPDMKPRVLALGTPGGNPDKSDRPASLSGINPENVKDHARFAIADDFGAIVMATEGAAAPFFESDEHFRAYDSWKRFYEEILKNGHENNPGAPELFSDTAPLEEKARSLSNWCDFYVPGFHDDRTILIIK
ncbi:MAG: protein phosphatase 2C domain-containing protein [Deltaproteobacteria bacterium]|jgi:hypothetical protein|nr:protein phosphatase 2C domain-containing protein [Deltaproteobacteria bacterium]